VVLDWWKAKLGDYSLAALTPELLSRHRDLLQAEEGLSNATVNRYLSVLSKAFSNAVTEWHLLQDNPLRRVSKRKKPSGRVRYLSDAERSRLLEACRISERKDLYLLVLIALTTGMRRGELLGMRWQDVDLERRVAVLHKTKNRERRSVPLVPEVVELLRDHGKVRRLDSELIFPGEGNGPLWFDAEWYKALQAAKVKDFPFHDLRHTAASSLAMSGATVPELAAVLGHKTLAMVKRYAHLSDQHTGAVVERMTQKYFSR